MARSGLAILCRDLLSPMVTISREVFSLSRARSLSLFLSFSPLSLSLSLPPSGYVSVYLSVLYRCTKTATAPNQSKLNTKLTPQVSESVKQWRDMHASVSSFRTSLGNAFSGGGAVGSVGGGLGGRGRGDTGGSVSDADVRKVRECV